MCSKYRGAEARIILQSVTQGQRPCSTQKAGSNPDGFCARSDGATGSHSPFKAGHKSGSSLSDFVSRGDRQRHDFSRPVQCPKGSQKGVQISIHAAEVNYAFVHDRRGHDCADSDELVEVNVHVFEIVEHWSEKRLLIQTAVRLEDLEWVCLRSVGLELPRELAGLHVYGIELAVMVANVGKVTGQCCRRKHICLSVKVETQAAVLGIECHEARTVGCAHIHHSVAHGRRAIHPGLARGIIPPLASCCRVDRVHMGITTSDVNGPINHGGGRLESDLMWMEGSSPLLNAHFSRPESASIA